MKKNIIAFLFILSVFAFYACKKDNVTQTNYWQENIGSNKTLPLLPDSNVNYFLYSFTRLLYLIVNYIISKIKNFQSLITRF